MPTYSYECQKCTHLFEVFHPMSEDPKIKCEKCKAKCNRLFGTGAGIIFKGSGFYETDYKQKKGKPPSEKKKDGADASEKKAESKEKTKPKNGKGDSPAKAESASKN